MTAMNPQITGSPTSISPGTTPGYNPHAMSQLPGLGAAGNAADNFQSIGDYASSGNYAGGTGNSDEPLDVKQARFNSQPFLRRPFGPQEM